MKKELKIKRKVGLAILGLLTVFASCEKEDTHHHKHEKANIVRNVKLSDLRGIKRNVLNKKGRKKVKNSMK